jgi:hypothetical protein
MPSKENAVGEDLHRLVVQNIMKPKFEGSL